MTEDWVETMKKALASEESSLLIPDSEELEELDQPRRLQSKDMLRKLEENKAFARLYRDGQQGDLLQVVRRKDFKPIKSISLKNIQLRNSLIAPSPNPSLNSDSQRAPEVFRYPYWNYLPKPSLLPTRKSSDIFSTRPVQQHHRTYSIQTEPKNPHVQVILPQIKVKRRTPSLEFLLTARNDLGLDIDEGEMTKRLVKGSSTVRVKNKGEKRKKNKQAVRKNSEDWEEERREKEMTEQAKVMFMTGVFAKLHNKERTEKEREMAGWLRYC